MSGIPTYPRPVLLLLATLWSVPSFGETPVANDPAAAILGDALLSNSAADFLEDLCDLHGPRMIGTDGHRGALRFLERHLRQLGYSPRPQDFSFPGWERGEASVRVEGPLQRELRAIALGYVGNGSVQRAPLLYLESNEIESLDPALLNGKVLLLKPNLRLSLEQWHQLAKQGVLGGLMINRVDGGQLLARTTNHGGESTPIPVFSITSEEGHWLRRLLERELTVTVSLSCSNINKPMRGTNLIATLPGQSEEKIVLGAHFDSWDLGQGAIDNGLGVAQVLEVARLLKKRSPLNRYTIEFVWFDAEEFGLWGARRYVESNPLDPIRAMVNLDMVGKPIQVNAMGFSALVPTLDAFNASLGAWAFDKPTADKMWLGSDHQAFALKGVPVITFNAPIAPEDVRYYHDHADTFDHIDTRELAEASAITALLVHFLANDPAPHPGRLTEAEAADLFTKAGLKERLQASGLWPDAFETAISGTD
jgi:hypothetical protein